MRPIRLTLDGFLSYRSPETIDFTSFDVACITGENGAGKSSILDGMTFALFGKARVNSGDALINNGREDAIVSFEFMLNDIHYRVIRKIYRNYRAAESFLHYFDPSTDQFVTLSGTTKSQTDAEIQKLLNMDHETFITASFFLQGKADTFAKSTPADRKKILGKILHLEAWDGYYESAKERKKDAKGESKALENEIKYLNSEIEKEADILKRTDENKQQLIDLGNEIEKANINLRNVVQLINNLNILREDIKTKQESIEKKREQLQKKNSQLEDKTKERNSAQALIDRSDEIKNQLKELGNATSFIYEQSMINLRIEGLRAQISEVEKLITSKEEQISTKITHLRSQEWKIIQDNQALTELREKLARLITSSGESKETKNKLEELNIRKSIVDDFTTSYTSYLTSNSRLNELLDRRNREMEALSTIQESAGKALEVARTIELELTNEKSKLHDLEGKNEEYLILSRTLSDLENQIQRSEDDLTKVKERATHLNEQHSPNCPTCEKPLSEIEKTELLSKLALETTSLRKRIDTISEEQRRLENEQGRLRGDRAGSEPFGSEILSIKQNCAVLRSKLEAQQEIASAWTDDKLARLTELKEPSADHQKLETEVSEGSNDLQGLFKDLFPGSAWSDHTTASKDVTAEGKALNASISELKTKLQELESIPVAIEQTETRIQTIEQADADWIENGKKELQQAESDLHGRVQVSGELAKVEDLKTQIQESGYDPEQIVRYQEFLDHNKDRIEDDATRLTAAPAIVSDRDKDILELTKELDEFGNDISALEYDITQKQTSMGDENALTIQKAQLESQVHKLENKTRELTLDLGKGKQQLEDINKHKQSLDEKQSLLEKSQKELINLEILEKAFGKNGVPALLIEQAKPEIEDEANRILSKITDGFSIRLQTQKEYKNQKREEAQETLEIEISDGSGSRDYDTYSGGETFRVNFALRLALSKMLAHRADAKLETLVIDEGFGSQDEDGKQKLVEAIKAIQSEFKMILVITHMEELKEKFDRRIDVRKVGRTSRVTVS